MLAGMGARMALVGLLCLTLCAGCGDDNGDGGKVVEGTRYELTVPDGWNDQSERADDAEFAGFRPEVILTGEREEGFQPNLNVIHESSLAPDVDLDSYLETTRSQLEGGSVPGADLGRDVEVGEPAPARLGGERALTFDHSRSVEDKRLKVRQLIALRGGGAYVLTYTALEDRFEDDLGRFESAVDSWRWK
jgi:hypothetical protein